MRKKFWKVARLQGYEGEKRQIYPHILPLLLLWKRRQSMRRGRGSKAVWIFLKINPVNVLISYKKFYLIFVVILKLTNKLAKIYDIVMFSFENNRMPKWLTKKGDTFSMLHTSCWYFSVVISSLNKIWGKECFGQL